MSVPISYWSKQSPKFGLRDLLNDKVYIDPSTELTDPRWLKTLSLIREELRGDESKALDFYCGSGRFTQDLAELIDGEALGVDTSLPLINEATSSSRTRFIHTPDGRVPTGVRTMDIVLVNHALGSLRGRLLERAVGEIFRVLKPEGLLVLIENTADLPDTRHHIYRSVETYQQMFPGIDWKRDPVHVESHVDPSAMASGDHLPGRMSVLIGRMHGGDEG